MGQSVIITAATAGIGLGIAHRLGQEGARLTICSRRQVLGPLDLRLPCCSPGLSLTLLHMLQQNVDEALAQLRAAGVGAVGCAANVGNKQDLARLVQLAVSSWGGVDVLVSNAAVNPAAGLILEMPDSAIDKILDINVKSAILLARETRPHLRKACARPCLARACWSP